LPLSNSFEIQPFGYLSITFILVKVIGLLDKYRIKQGQSLINSNTEPEIIEKN